MLAVFGNVMLTFSCHLYRVFAHSVKMSCHLVISAGCLQNNLHSHFGSHNPSVAFIISYLGSRGQKLLTAAKSMKGVTDSGND